MSPSTQESIQKLLTPLEEHHASGDYFRQHQSMVEFDRCLRELEARYANLFEQVSVLEKNLSI